MHKYLILIYENDENGNKKKGVEPTYITLDDELKVSETYKRYRNIYQTDGQGQSTGIKAYTVELSKLEYKIMSKADADAFVDSIVVA